MSECFLYIEAHFSSFNGNDNSIQFKTFSILPDLSFIMWVLFIKICYWYVACLLNIGIYRCRVLLNIDSYSVDHNVSLYCVYVLTWQIKIIWQKSSLFEDNVLLQISANDKGGQACHGFNNGLIWGSVKLFSYAHPCLLSSGKCETMKLLSLHFRPPLRLQRWANFKYYVS